MIEVDQLYLEDLHIGQRFTSGTHVMEEAKIKEFAAEFDPQPFHLDASAAQSSVFKGLAASGWHTAAIAMRLLVSGGLPLANGIVGLGVEITWPRPTRPGDILRVESEIVDITPSRSKSNQAVVAVRSTMLNQNDQTRVFLKRQAACVQTPRGLFCQCSAAPPLILKEDPYADETAWSLSQSRIHEYSATVRSRSESNLVGSRGKAR